MKYRKLRIAWSVVLAVIPWFRCRFSLRTLLVAAVGLGLIVYAQKS